MELGSCSTRYVTTIIKAAERLGADRRALLKLLQVDDKYLALPTHRIGSAKVIDLFHLAIELTGDPVFGLHVGESFKPGTFDILGCAIMCSNTLRDAIQLNYRYQPLTQQLGVTPLIQEGDCAVLEWRPRLPDAQRLRPVNEAVMTGYANVGRWLTWHDQYPIMRMQFAHAVAADMREYERIFNCPIEFAAPRTAMHFARTFLDAPLQQADPTTVELLIGQLDRRLQRFNNGEAARDQLACYLQSRLPIESPTLVGAAEALGYSERTLRRRLRQERTSFRDVLDDVRKNSVLAYLRSPHHRLADIAQLLGYQDQSTFTHAFRSWYQQSPGQFRARLISQ